MRTLQVKDFNNLMQAQNRLIYCFSILNGMFYRKSGYVAFGDKYKNNNLSAYWAKTKKKAIEKYNN